MAILIERIRREGYEFQVAKPQVIDKEIDGQKMTPYERIYIEVPEEYNGQVLQKFNKRRGELQDMRTDSGIASMEFLISTRSFVGYRREFVTDTRGLGIINTIFDKYDRDNGYVHQREQGSLVAHETGVTNQYGIANIQDRGVLFVGPGVNVYKGQVVGQNSRDNDLRVNVCKAKELSNMRSKGDGPTAHLKNPKAMSLEDALEYISDDELVEVTPKNIRIRKIILDEVEERRRQSLTR